MLMNWNDFCAFVRRVFVVKVETFFGQNEVIIVLTTFQQTSFLKVTLIFRFPGHGRDKLWKYVLFNFKNLQRKPLNVITLMQSQNYYITQIITIVKSATYIKYLKTGIREFFNLTILPMITFFGFQLSILLKNEFNFRQNLICAFTFSLYFQSTVYT